MEINEGRAVGCIILLLPSLLVFTALLVGWEVAVGSFVITALILALVFRRWYV
jgi:membrane protein implicated in regulation of membrane protease activity